MGPKKVTCDSKDAKGKAKEEAKLLSLSLSLFTARAQDWSKDGLDLSLRLREDQERI